LAHGLPTSYAQFIDKLWEDIIKRIQTTYDLNYTDDFVEIKQNMNNVYRFLLYQVTQSVRTHEDLRNILKNRSLNFTIKNKFLEHITKQKQRLKNWVDIEEEYYKFLCDGINPEENTNTYSSEENVVKALNSDFESIKKALNQYLLDLIDEYKIDLKPISLIGNIVESLFRDKDFVIKRDFDVKEILNKKPENQLYLNFNYTNLEKYYIADESDSNSIIHIHGSINDKANPIIFGYGDELDDHYKKIEKLKKNDYLENVKSIKYLETDNYKRLLSFINSDYYQVVILGHSCGNSDRTLLNTLFEHEYCISIKPYYYKYKDPQTGEIKDNYSDIVRNISRSFTDKKSMRDKVVNKTYTDWFSRDID
jgi:hypothetical protein